MTDSEEVLLLQRRVKKLERRLASFAVASVLLIILVTLLEGIEYARSQPLELRARTIQLFDKQGRNRIFLGSDSTGMARPRLLDQTGETRVALNASTTTAVVAPDGTPRLTLHDSDESERVILDLPSSGPILTLNDSRKKGPGHPVDPSQWATRTAIVGPTRAIPIRLPVIVR